VNKVANPIVDRRSRALLSFLLSLLACGHVFAQPGSDEFNPMVLSDFAGVRALAIQGDGRVWIGGWFNGVGVELRTNLARLNPDGTVDTHFSLAANEMVNALVVQPDGKVLAAGGFTQIGGQTWNGIARLNADGTFDGGFFGNVGGSVAAVALQPDGKIVVGGSFAMLGWQTHNSLGRLEVDGTVDTGFSADVEGEVYSVLVQTDGKIIAGGYFTMPAPDGTWRTNLVRLNPDGTLDTGFDPNANAQVWALALQPDGGVLVGGSFTSLGRQPRSHMGRLNADGSLDASFNPSVDGTSPTVFSIALQTDGKIAIGGDFTTVAGQSRSYLARLNADGTLDNEFNPVANGLVNALAMQANGKLLVGGQFSYLGGWARYCLGRLAASSPATQSLSVSSTTIAWLRGGTSPEVSRTTFEHSFDGLTWTPLGEGSRISGGWQLSAVSVPAGGTLRARGCALGGYGNASSWLVETFGGAPIFLAQPVAQAQDAGGMATFRAAAAGSDPLTFQWLRNGAPLAQADNVIGTATATLTLSNVLGGDAGTYAVVVTNSFGSVTSTVATLTVVDPVIVDQPASQSRELGQSVTFSVTANGTGPLAYQWSKDNALLSGATGSALTLTNLQAGDAGTYRVVVSNQWSSITSTGALLTVNLITLDTNSTIALNGSVYALIQQPDGKLVLGGDFTSLGGQPRNRIGRLNADGTLDANFNPNVGSPGVVDALALQSDGKLVVGGTYFTVGGQPRTNLARLNPDGTLDPVFNPGSDYAGYVYSLALQPDGKILVGGEFATIAGQARSKIARLNADGTLDKGFVASADNGVEALAVLPGGKILLGGWFHYLDGQWRSGLARVNSDGTLDYAFNPSPNAAAMAFAPQADGKILVGGAFTQFGGQVHSNLVRLQADGSLDPDFHAQAGTVYENDYPIVYSVAVQVDQKIIVGGSFSVFNGESRYYLSRLNADGTLDMGFNPTISSAVLALALRSDGRILIPGTAVTPDSQWHSGLLLFNNDAPATEDLSLSSDSITWLRGDTGPEAWRATFEYSTDGLVWTPLGEGARINGGWQLDDVGVPSGGTVRARGYLTGGQYNGSCWFVEATIGRPIFVDAPANRTNNAGTTATLEVVAGGSGPFSYQWSKDRVPLADGGNVQGATTAVLQISNVLKADEGGYTVTISNAFGSATSAVARLTVIDPVIAVQPLSQMRQMGETATLTVGAIGTGPLSYQWFKEDAPVNGGTAAVLDFPNLQAGDAGYYYAIVSNQFGSATSAVALLTVNVATLDSASAPTANGAVYTVALQPDAKVLVGGAFTRLGSQVCSNLARLNPDGTLDATFNPSPPYEVRALAIQPDGRIIAGGDLTRLTVPLRTPLSRFNANGTLDTSFTAGSSASGGVVNALAIQPDGKILVGGTFTTLGGVLRTNLARLSTNGVVDSTFNPAPRGNSGSRWGYMGAVQCLALQADGKILLGGTFTSVAGQTRDSFVRLNADGSIDPGFNPGANSSVLSLVIQADGKILVGGNFTRMAGQSCTNLARLNLDGSLDASFTPGSVTGAAGRFQVQSPSVTSFGLQTDGTILIGGIFTSIGGQMRTNLAALDSDGTLSGTFNPAPGGSIVSSLNTVALQTDGKVVVGGSFNSISGQWHTNLARLNSTAPAAQGLIYDGATITWLRSGAVPEIWRATFEASTNAAAWFALGPGQRVPGGWQLTNITVQPGATIRARGFVGGSGIGESIVESTLHARPVIATDDSLFGVLSNRFGFSVDGLAGWTVVVERSPDLRQWLPIQTNLMSSNRLYFSDSEGAQFPSQFYRARLWP
jgi:uncharacterized delta-60 repeat protein